MLAAAEGRLGTLVDRFLAEGDGVPEFALHAAARGGDPATVRKILRAGADPNQPNEVGQTPLHAAAQSRKGDHCDRHAEAVRLLLQAGADPTIKNRSGHTAFEEARPYHQELIPLLKVPGKRP